MFTSTQPIDLRFFNALRLTGNVYSKLPAERFIGKPKNGLSHIQDHSIFAQEAPLYRARHDPKLSYFQRCWLMYRALMGVHYVENNLSQAQKSVFAAPEDATLLSEFKVDDWNVFYVPDGLDIRKVGRTLESKNMMLQQRGDETHYILKEVGKRHFFRKIKTSDLKKSLENLVEKGTGRESSAYLTYHIMIQLNELFVPKQLSPSEISLDILYPRKLKDDMVLVHPLYKTLILYHVFKERKISLDRAQLNPLQAQLGLLDLLILPLIARKIYYVLYDLLARKQEENCDFVMRCILYVPFVVFLPLIVWFALEVLRHALGIAFTLVCALTVMPVLHFFAGGAQEGHCVVDAVDDDLQVGCHAL